ncbi:MAG: LytTR family DNA-binding domain-containing protein [Steroidobacteraceae bacterium]
MKSENPLRVLIVDDESLAREHIKELLKAMPSVSIVGEAVNGLNAVKAIKELAPDLVFMDVQMPGLSGIDVVRQIGPDLMPITIFVTAYDHYAVNAFDLAAVDYLLKPFDDDRFDRAVQRARTLHEMRDSTEMGVNFRKALDYLNAARPTSKEDHQAAEYVERIAIESRGQVRMVITTDIEYITASGPYVELHVGAKTHLVRTRMQSLEAKLDPKMFFRIHRSVIVHLNRIDVLLRQAGGDYSLRLKNGMTFPVSRNRIEELEHWMGVPEDVPRASRA